jgi:ABC-type antimicrobial peptide transport system permease subunit
MLTQLIQQNFFHLIYAIAGVILGTILIIGVFKYWQLKRIFEIDEMYEELDTGRNIIKKGHPRNRWDYAAFPGMARLFHKSEWQELFGMVFLLIFLVVYLATSNEVILFLVGVNFGTLIGTQIQRKQKDDNQ